MYISKHFKDQNPSSVIPPTPAPGYENVRHPCHSLSHWFPSSTCAWTSPALFPRCWRKPAQISAIKSPSRLSGEPLGKTPGTISYLSPTSLHSLSLPNFCPYSCIVPQPLDCRSSQLLCLALSLASLQVLMLGLLWSPWPTPNPSPWNLSMGPVLPGPQLSGRSSINIF